MAIKKLGHDTGADVSHTNTGHVRYSDCPLPKKWKLLKTYLFIYLFGAKKADRLTVVIESMQGLLKKCCECTFYIKVVK